MGAKHKIQKVLKKSEDRIYNGTIAFKLGKNCSLIPKSVRNLYNPKSLRRRVTPLFSIGPIKAFEALLKLFG